MVVVIEVIEMIQANKVKHHKKIKLSRKQRKLAIRKEV